MQVAGTLQTKGLIELIKLHQLKSIRKIRAELNGEVTLIMKKGC
jgi:hypothetical protein